MDSSRTDILTSPLARKLLGHTASIEDERLPFLLDVITRLDFLLRNPANREPLSKIGIAALDAFIQANVTGPPLTFSSEEVIYPLSYRGNPRWQDHLRQAVLGSLAVDGEAVYQHTPHVELFWLAKLILDHNALNDDLDCRRAKLRVNLTHQKLLLEQTENLRGLIVAEYETLESDIKSQSEVPIHELTWLASFYIERAAVYIHNGLDARARQDLIHAANLTNFEFKLTGRLGKRTKFQDQELSQLVVLARSFSPDISAEGTNRKDSHTAGGTPQASDTPQNSTKPPNIGLDDDTLLETISFTKSSHQELFLPQVESSDDSSHSLASIDPEDQPFLHPLDAIILLNLASSISNTNPQDGLTREETLPYATRVLQGGSSNWQIYTQALLVRSRVEGYRTRTAERGLLQLQALVDQVIAETSGHTLGNGQSEAAPTTFLPKSSASETAAAAERLKYVWQLDFSMRWELEAELAARWVHMGGLRTALGIYERLQMWAEVALCLAATEEEGKATTVIRKLLYEPNASANNISEDLRAFDGDQKAVLPADAPRLFCILGDLEKNPQHYEMAWSVSHGRYARAQRSLGQHFAQAKQYERAADAYTKCLRVSQLSAPTWFAFGCIQLQLQDWSKAVESFTRTVQLEDNDAEAWSNLAVALLQLPPNPQSHVKPASPLADEDDSAAAVQSHTDPFKHRKDALRALRRAATLRNSDARVWENFLTVAASIPPPETPYSDVILAQKRVIELQAKLVGDKVIDESILAMLTRYVTSTFKYPNPASTTDNKPSPFRPSEVPQQLLDIVDQDIIPNITSSSRLWLLVAELADWRRRPLMALEAQEKAWRTVTSKSGMYETEDGWQQVVDATVHLAQAYENYGPMLREQAGPRDTSKAKVEEVLNLVARDWKFKTRSAVRSVRAKGKENWEGGKGWEVLEGLLKDSSGS